MIKKILKTLVILLYCQSYISAGELQKNLHEFALMVSSSNKINILISDDVETEKYSFYIADENQKILLPAFKQMLTYKGLVLNKSNGFYFIDKKEKEDEPVKNFYYVSLDNIIHEDLLNLFEILEIQTKYIKNTNALVYRATLEQNKKIRQAISKIDKALEQVQFKITVLETSINAIKERGSNLSAYMQSNNTLGENDTILPYNYFLNLITMPYSATTNVLSNSKQGFYAVLKYLDNNGITKIQNSPVLTAQSNSKVNFSSVQNIPYLTTSKQIVDTQTSQTNSYDYKDVGLKIDILPTVLNEKIDFELNLTIEDVLSSNSLTPTVSKKSLSSKYSLHKGELLVLSGINRESELTNSYGIPVLKDVYLLGELFKYESKEKTNSVLTITIEVI